MAKTYSTRICEREFACVLPLGSDIDAFVRDTVMKARVVGLRARPELNNTTVTTLTFVLDRGRFAVETSTSERVLLKPCFRTAVTSSRLGAAPSRFGPVGSSREGS